MCDRLRLFPDWLIGWVVPSVWWAVSPRPGEIYPERLLALPYIVIWKRRHFDLPWHFSFGSWQNTNREREREEQPRQWDLDWKLGTLWILELTWPRMVQVRGGLGMSRICCSRGLVSLLIGAPGTQWVKPEKRETPKRHRNIRNARNEGGREGQGREREAAEGRREAGGGWERSERRDGWAGPESEEKGEA